MDLEVNAVKPQYIVMSRDQNAGRILNLKTEKRNFCDSLEKFMYLGTKLTNQNSVKEEIKRILSE
jgi:hypothetical protein